MNIHRPQGPERRLARPAPERGRLARVRPLAALALALFGSGCGGGMSGVYANDAGHGSLEFRPNGTVYVTVFGGTFEGEYEVDGERVIVRGPSGAQVYTKAGERLDGGFGTLYVKQERAEAQ